MLADGLEVIVNQGDGIVQARNFSVPGLHSALIIQRILFGPDSCQDSVDFKTELPELIRNHPFHLSRAYWPAADVWKSFSTAIS